MILLLLLKGGALNKFFTMGKFEEALRNSTVAFNGLMVLGFLGIVWLMIYGNLSTNIGFTSGTAGYNNTEAVIANLTQGAGTFFGFSNTLFTIVAIVLLITILLALLYIVLGIVKMTKKGGGGFAE